MIYQLEQVGIIWEPLIQEVDLDLDSFDMICDVVYEQSTLTRREWANKFKKHNYLPQYSTAVQTVLNNLLTKYVDVGIQEIENIQVLKVRPFTKIGSLS